MNFVLKKYKSKKTQKAFYYLQYGGIEVRFEHLGVCTPRGARYERDYTKVSIRRADGKVSSYLAFNKQDWNKDVCDAIRSLIWIKNTFPEYQDLYSAAQEGKISLQK